MKKSLDKAEMDLSIVTEKYLASKKTVTEADLRCKSYLTDFRAAEDKLKSLKETGEDLVTEHSKLELELEDRKSLTTDNAVNPFCHLTDFLKFQNYIIFRKS